MKIVIIVIIMIIIILKINLNKKQCFRYLEEKYLSKGYFANLAYSNLLHRYKSTKPNPGKLIHKMTVHTGTSVFHQNEQYFYIHLKIMI